VFVLICIVHILQWMHIRDRVKSITLERKKLLIIFTILSATYLTRALFNTIQPRLRQIQCYKYPQNFAWCGFIVFFYGFQMFLPIQILFYFQFQKNNEVNPVLENSVITTISRVSTDSTHEQYTYVVPPERKASASP
jgi:hypothetical protein